MQFTTGNLSRCAGNGHYELPITVSGNTKTLRFTRDQLRGEPAEDMAQAVDAILARLRSAAKEANATTLAQVRAAVESKTFKV